MRRAAAFLETVRTRRSIREFAPDPVPLEAIDLAVQAAGLAPSGANQQPWTFVVVSDPDTKKAIREAAEEEERANYGGRMPRAWLEALAPLQTDWHKEFLEIAPVLVVVFKQDHGTSDTGERVTHYYVNESVGLACGFFLLALHEMGLAALTHTPSPMGFLSKILGRPPSEKPILLVPVGYPATGCRVPDLKKKALDQIRVRIG